MKWKSQLGSETAILVVYIVQWSQQVDWFLRWKRSYYFLVRGGDADSLADGAVRGNTDEEPG